MWQEGKNCRKGGEVAKEYGQGGKTVRMGGDGAL